MSDTDRPNKIPAAIRKIFGKPPIMAGEDPADYAELMELVRADVEPRHLPEWLLLKDIVDAEWELLRLRGLKVAMLHVMVPRAINAQLRDTTDLVAMKAEWAPAARRYLIAIAAGDQQAKKDFDQLFEAHGLTLDLAIAAAFETTIVPQLQTDRMASEAYHRRNLAYAELERLRANPGVAARLQIEANERQLMDAYAPPTAPGNGAPAGRARP